MAYTDVAETKIWFTSMYLRGSKAMLQNAFQHL
jgi:hypothetical protein